MRQSESKKLLVNLKRRSQFVGPGFLERGDPLIELATGRKVDEATVVYSGKVVSPSEFLERYASAPPNTRTALREVARFLDEVASLKIGSVVRGVRAADGGVVLRAEEPRTSKRPGRLP